MEMEFSIKLSFTSRLTIIHIPQAKFFLRQKTMLIVNRWAFQNKGKKTKDALGYKNHPNPKSQRELLFSLKCTIYGNLFNTATVKKTRILGYCIEIHIEVNGASALKGVPIPCVYKHVYFFIFLQI
jgi:hypothetical protein